MGCMCRIWRGCDLWLFLTIPLLPISLLVLLCVATGEYIGSWRQRRRERAEKRKWERYGQYPNGTIITGRLDDIELRPGTDARPTSPTSPQTLNIPHLPPEIIREIILYATDTYPSPASRHRASTLSPSPYPPFPYSTEGLAEDTDVDRRLHILSMRVKLAVSRVSRTWREVAVEFLFNSIRVEDPRQIPLLGRTLEADARRRGLRDTGSRAGTAAWWVRELWFDSERYTELPPKRRPKLDLAAFELVDLLKLCPNIVVFRGIGRCSRSRYPLELTQTSVIDELRRLPAYQQDPQDPSKYITSEAEIPDNGRRMALHLVDPFPSFHIRRASRWLHGAACITIHAIVHLELSYIMNSLNPQNNVTALLPNLTHISIWGAGSLNYAARKLEMPRLASVVYGKGSTSRRDPSIAPNIERFLRKNGARLEELTVLDSTIGGQLMSLGALCPVLQTFRAPLVVIPLIKLSSVTTLGLYGLEEFGGAWELGEVFVRGILQALPKVAVIQDSSWRSCVVRRRAYTNWRDPEGARRRKFWTHFISTIKAGSEISNRCGSVTELDRPVVTFVDWKGGEVDPVPTGPPEHEMISDSDKLLEAIMYRASFPKYSREP